MKAKWPVHCNMAHNHWSQNWTQSHFIDPIRDHYYILNSNHLLLLFTAKLFKSFYIFGYCSPTKNIHAYHFTEIDLPGSPMTSMLAKPTVPSLDSSSTSSKQHWNPLFLSAMTSSFLYFAFHSLLWALSFCSTAILGWFSPIPLATWPLHLHFQRWTEDTVWNYRDFISSFTDLLSPHTSM